MKDTVMRVMITILLVVNTILMVFVCNMVFSIHEQLNKMGDVATKSDLLAVSIPTLKIPFQEKCTGCHTEKRFADIPLDEMHKSVFRMMELPGAIHLVPVSDKIFKQGYGIAEHRVFPPVVFLLLITVISCCVRIEPAPQTGPGRPANRGVTLRIGKPDTQACQFINIWCKGLWMTSHSMNGIVQVIADYEDYIWLTEFFYRLCRNILYCQPKQKNE